MREHGESLRVQTPGGYEVPVTWFPGEPGKPVILFMAALGTPAGFYRPLAGALAAKGFSVALMEQRGHGDSALRASRRSDWGFREQLENDLPAVMAETRRRAPGVPLYLMGHSLGGHYSAMMAGLRPDEVDGVILTACASPWIRAFHGIMRFQVRLLTLVIPVVNRLFGYYPGNRIGFGGREARTLMKDWRHMATENRYVAEGLGANMDAGIADYTGPVLAIRLADDAFGPEDGVKAVTGKFRSAKVQHRVINAEELGDRADHYRWARTPGAVAEAVAGWH